MASKIEVMLAEDMLMVQKGMRLLIDAEDDFMVVGATKDVEEIVRLALRRKPDVILMDYSFKGQAYNGVWAIKTIKEKFTERELRPPGIVMLSAHDKIVYILKALEAGARGYFLKESDTFLLFDTIRWLYSTPNSTTYRVDPAIHFDENMRKIAKAKMGLAEKITDSELEIIKLLLRGSSREQIIVIQNISESAYHNHYVNIFQKLSINELMELLFIALEVGWITSEDIGRDDAPQQQNSNRVFT